MPLETGTRLGHYEIVAAIGSGGMGEVYRARDTKLGREVAAKVLPEAFLHDTDRVARFEREAKALAALNHPHIAALYEMAQDGGRQFLVMELIEGITLRDLISSGSCHSNRHSTSLVRSPTPSRQRTRRALCIGISSRPT